MKNKLYILIAAVLFLSAPLFSQEWIIDNAGNFSANAKAGLAKQMAEISSTYNFDLMILTEKSIGSADPITYAWNYLDGKGLKGTEWVGCLLLLVTGRGPGDRDYVFTASGRGSKILTNVAYDELESRVLQHLKNSDYVKASETYINIWEKYLILDAKGRTYNFFTHYNAQGSIGVWVFAFLVGFTIVRKWKNDMNTARPKSEADIYIIPGSLNITRREDRFLYSNVTKTKKQSSSSGGSSSRSGGGRSSRSGKF